MFSKDPCPAPEDSIYFWMYRQGLRGIPFTEVVLECNRNGHAIRRKDQENWERGYAKHNMNAGDPMGVLSVGTELEPYLDVYNVAYSEYPDHPRAGSPELEDRFIYVREDGVIPYKWGDPSNRMTRADALSSRGCKTLAENLKGTQFIVIDCDGDHGGKLDFDTIAFFRKLALLTQVFIKPKAVREYPEAAKITGEKLNWYPSFHLTYHTDKVIPTRHFTRAHVDILGNKENQVRYFKNKVSNNRPIAEMNDETWKLIMEYLERRETQ